MCSAVHAACGYAHMHVYVVSCLDPALTITRREKGLVTIEVGCAESAVLLLGKPIRLQFSIIPRDIYCNGIGHVHPDPCQ